jgi:hypothetical protein
MTANKLQRRFDAGLRVFHQAPVNNTYYGTVHLDEAPSSCLHIPHSKCFSIGNSHPEPTTFPLELNAYDRNEARMYFSITL